MKNRVNWIHAILGVTLLVAFTSCKREPKVEALEGFIPIYEDHLENLVSLNISGQKLENPGKIYLYKDFAFVIEREKGIHVFNNSNPSSPTEIAFYTIPGCSEISIRNDFLYTNLGYGLLCLDISSPTDAKAINHQMYNSNSTEASMPAVLDHGFGLRDKVYYLCPDPDRGRVLGWYYGKFESNKYCTLN